jgi:DNA-3-methyladenine glycosylase I
MRADSNRVFARTKEEQSGQQRLRKVYMPAKREPGAKAPGKQSQPAKSVTEKNKPDADIKELVRVEAMGAVMCDDGLARTPWAATDAVLREYYDTEWGMPVRDERGLFERVALEGFQSGLSWVTILRKRDAFRAAFCDFVPETVAKFDDEDVARLLADPAIIRNRAKILATVKNAAATIALRAEGGLVDFVWSFQPKQTPMPRTVGDVPTTSEESIALSEALRKKGFSFVGPTTMHALMEAIGMIDTHLLDSHRRGSSGVWPRVTRNQKRRQN